MPSEGRGALCNLTYSRWPCPQGPPLPNSHKGTDRGQPQPLESEVTLPGETAPAWSPSLGLLGFCGLAPVLAQWKFSPKCSVHYLELQTFSNAHSLHQGAMLRSNVNTFAEAWYLIIRFSGKPCICTILLTLAWFLKPNQMVPLPFSCSQIPCVHRHTSRQKGPSGQRWKWPVGGFMSPPPCLWNLGGLALFDGISSRPINGSGPCTCFLDLL